MLCLLILAALWLAAAQAQPPLANDSVPHILSQPADNYQPLARPNSFPSGGENVELVGQIGGSNNDVAVLGNYAYIGVGPRLVILDISDSANPIMIGQTEVLPDFIRDIAIAGNYAYIANGSSGLRIINIANPQNPTEVASFDTLAVGVKIAGNYA